MKKVIIVILSLLLLAGVGVFGYTIFFSKNIESVEYEGSVQTLYLVDECTSPKFGDGRLKVTYKGGSIKYISMEEAFAAENIEVKDFTTSIPRSKEKMKLNYKNHVIEIDYFVIDRGMYYVYSHKRINGNTTSFDITYDINKTGEVFEILGNGGLKYYTKKAGTVADWYLYDGANISSYKYEIVGDTLKIYLGEAEPAYNVTASKDEYGKTVISAVKSKFNTEGMETSRETKVLKHIEKKTNAKVSTSSLAFANNSYVEVQEGNVDKSYFKFYVNEKFSDRKGDIFLKISYTTPLISLDTETSSEAVMQTLFVVVDDSMVKGAPLDTRERWDYNRTVVLWYESIDFELKYQVKPKN